MIEIVKSGPLALVQDLGRPGRQELGIGHSGAADRSSHELANRLVGNLESAAGLELTLGGLVARFTHNAVIAVTGADARPRVDERAVDMNSPVHLKAGQTLHIGQPHTGLRVYLAVRGGIDVAEVAGSRSTDLLSGLGPPPVKPGQRLPVGAATCPAPAVDHAPRPPVDAHPVLRVRPGPRDDWFTDRAVEALFCAEFEVSADSNRVAIRLRGPALERATDRELPSEPLVCGAIQVPPDGLPLLFLADHPVTGGYPVIGVVPKADQPLAAQARPGQRLRFKRITAAAPLALPGPAARNTRWQWCGYRPVMRGSSSGRPCWPTAASGSGWASSWYRACGRSGWPSTTAGRSGPCCTTPTTAAAPGGRNNCCRRPRPNGSRCRPS